MTQKIVLWGATGQAKVLHELLHGSGIGLVALVDNNVRISPFPDVPVLDGLPSFDAWLLNQEKSVLTAAAAIGGHKGKDRIAILDIFHERDIPTPSLIHRTAFVAFDAQIGQGCQILANSAVCTHVQLGDGVIVNTAASIDHDCQIADGAHIGPGATLAGEVKIGACSFVGAGAVILPRLTIGDGSIVGAGATVTRDVAPGKIVIGNPARTLKSI